ncbi:tRNA 2-selenouridine(34) synthase MnmH [Leucothrix arctica]|uniref:tRNA 2-selenouridine synthase n=1 Tax=Leucothrix arctica TaxID=1481894 RepID=A0A317CCF3_9GAMM|nr:tRNA 2-selenouridine(34) synthase MnmH [Leucothrix arctica]PWQ93762.1 tRNA 2-selenouridine(34) synthase MnmH [Leucothrix arctica]
MPNTLEAQEYRRLFLEDVPMIDLRAPIEFVQGAFATSTSLPLMSDDEREAVGTCYKEEGQDAAIKLGHSLVSGDLKAERVAAWKAFIDQNPSGVLYCFRGGLRSRTTQQWIIDECGIDYPRVDGGYKALRRFLIDETERLIEKFNIVVLSGQSGTGKTRILKKIPHSLDLEGLANHRGSAFGNTTTPQPTQINFENDVAITLLKAEAAGYKTIVVEDESRNVGSLHVPPSLHAKMTDSYMVMLDVSDEDRVDITVQEYAKDIHLAYCEQFGKDEGLKKLSEHLQGSLAKLQKRLGGERFTRMKQTMDDGITLLSESNDYSGFAGIFGELLIDYYDPMYAYQLSKKQDRISFTGSREEVLNHLSDEANLSP